jgi:Mrp family chromosome partitioning ATPase
VAIVAFASAKASPGATTVAALVAARWPRRRLLIEGDESGGVLASRLGLGTVPSSLELAASTPLTIDELERHTQREWLDVPILVAPAVPHQVRATFREFDSRLAEVLTTAAVDVIVDAGRVVPNAAVWPTVERSDLVVLVARPSLEEFTAVSARAHDLRGVGRRVALVVTSDGPYHAAEFAEAAEIELLGSLSYDPPALADLQQGALTRRVARSALWRDASALTEDLLSRCAACSIDENGR